MTRLIIGILAAIVLLIVNRDVLRPGETQKLTETDRPFLFGILAYPITGVSWAFCRPAGFPCCRSSTRRSTSCPRLPPVMLRTKYVDAYLDRKDAFATLLSLAGRAFLCFDRPDAKKIPVIALTANAFDEDVQLSLQAGMNAHLSKPVEPERPYQTPEELIRERNGKGSAAHFPACSLLA